MNGKSEVLDLAEAQELHWRITLARFVRRISGAVNGERRTRRGTIAICEPPDGGSQLRRRAGGGGSKCPSRCPARYTTRTDPREGREMSGEHGRRVIVFVLIVLATWLGAAYAYLTNARITR